MDLVRAFMDSEEKYEINIQFTPEKEPLFQASQIGKILDIKNIHSSIEKLKTEYTVIRQSDTLGGKQKMVFITEFGLYKWLSISKKPIAEKFQKWVFSVLKEIRLNGMYILEEQLKNNEINIKLLEDKNDNDLHNVLLNTYDGKRVIYIVKLKEQKILHNVDEEYNLYKIGKTDELKKRMHGLYTDFSTLVLVNVFECNNNCKLERYLHNHDDIKCHFKEVLPNKKETYMLNNEQLKKVVNIINHNLFKFRDITDENRLEFKRLEIEEKKLDIIKNGLDINKQQDKIQELIDFVKLQETIVDKPDYRLRKIKKTNSPKVQKYHPDTLGYIQTYDSVMDAVRGFPQNSTFNSGTLKLSAKNNTVYFGYRWVFLEREKEDIPYEIPPTEIVRTQHKGEYIAKMNISKTTIEKVYGSQKQAAEEYNVALSTITSAIKRNNRSNGGYWYYWNDIPQDIRDDYTNYNKLPERLYLSTSIKVQKINPNTNEIIETYNSIHEVQKLYQFSRLSLKNASNNNTVVKNFIWKIVNT